jgi:hypothetical protein
MLWRLLSGDPTTRDGISEYVKLAQIGLVMVGGSVMNEQVFSTLTIINNDLRSCLVEEDHLNVCLRLFCTKSYYSIKGFPFARAFSAWLEECKQAQRGRGGPFSLACPLCSPHLNGQPDGCCDAVEIEMLYYFQPLCLSWALNQRYETWSCEIWRKCLTESQYEILILRSRGWQARGEDELQSSGSRQHAGWMAETSSQQKVLGRRQS